MTILCRTGCNQQVIYEENEFPDGFIYLLPVNLDGTIHNCKNLSEKIKGFINYSNLDNVLKDKSELFKANFRLVDKSDYEYQVNDSNYLTQNTWNRNVSLSGDDEPPKAC